MTIRAALIINNHGKPRLTKFYTQLPASRQQALIKEIYRLVSKRPDGVCNFLDASELTALLPPSQDAIKFSSNLSRGNGKGKEKEKEREKERYGHTTNGSGGTGAVVGTSASQYNQDELRVIYRHYATLYFVFVVDQSESELGILDLIQVFVESLDRCFENVCELDLIFHFDEVHAILSEVIQGGLVVETNINEIVSQAQTTSRARKNSVAATSGNLGSLNPASLNLSLPGSAGWSSSGGGTGASSNSNNSGVSGATPSIPWPRGTFMVEAISNLGNQYLGRSTGRR